MSLNFQETTVDNRIIVYFFGVVVSNYRKVYSKLFPE